MNASKSDASLVERVLEGDRALFDTLAARHRADLFRYLRAAIGDADEAESLTQETFARALAQLAQYRPEMPFRAYLFGIAKNLIRNHFRAQRRHAKAVSPDQLINVAARQGRRPGILSDLVRGETGERLRSAVQMLPAPFRQAFVSHFIDGLDYAEISQKTGVAAGTLRVRAHRARALLRADLGTVVDTWLVVGRRGGPAEGSK